MTIFRNKQRGGTWRYDFVMAGARYHGPCLDADGNPVKTKTAAQAIEDAARVGARQKRALERSGVKSGSYTLSQACALYLARKEGNSASDFDNHKLYVAEIKAFFHGTKPMKDFTAEDVERYRKFAAAKTKRVWVGAAKGRATALPDDHYWKDTGRRRAPRQVNNYLKCLRGLLKIAEKVRDPITRQPILDEAPEVKLHRVPKRMPRPIGDDELQARLDEMPQWGQEALELSRLFGLRHGEAFIVELRHIYPDTGGLRFNAGETKSDHDELVHGGEAGSQLLLRLAAQARARGQQRLVTWPGRKHFRKFMVGKDIPSNVWQPLKSVRKSWVAAARRAGVEHPHRFHDVRARFVTEVARVQAAATQDAARHQDPATTALYIKLAATEIQEAVRQAVARRPVSQKLKAVI